MKKRRSVGTVEVVGIVHFDEATGQARLQMTVDEGLHARTLTYTLGAAADVRAQFQEPFNLAPSFPNWWVYRNKVVHVHGGTTSAEETVLLVKHCVLRQEASFQRVRREVEAMENLERVSSAQRERIPESVRLFVWQRDEGRCVSCGSRERLEFDHIIPLVEGGANTERNVQLLCEACNRCKGRQI